MQEAEIFLVRRRRVLGDQRVVSDTKHARRKQLLAITVLGKRSRLTYEPVDDVPVVDLLLIAAAQPRHTLDELLGVPHLQVLRVQPYLDLLADQSARHHVAVPLHTNQAALVHPTLQTLTRFQPPRGQGTQHRQFFREPLTPAGVELVQKHAQKTRVRAAAEEILAAPQHQRLGHGFLKTPVPLLDVAVLVGVSGLNLLPHESVMLQQSLITLPELLALRGVVHGQAHAIGPVPRRHTAQLPQRILQTFAQALETLREADRRRLPVRVGQHEVIDHVLERLPLDRHTQIVHAREVGRRQPARLVHLSEEHFLRRPCRGPPTPHLPLQGPQLPIGEPARIAALQVTEDRLGLQSRLLLQHCTNLRPDLGERIDPGPPVVRPRQLAGQPPKPPILPCRLVVHVAPRRRHAQPLAGRDQPPQFAHHLVGNHRKPPCQKSLQQSTHSAAARTGSRVPRPGNLIVVSGKSNCR